ncbi:putrescine hydroxycinnamoyltransferase 1-like [Ananas comosus]|uniref:Putrescine hydroxycinnamoyltransferase 1-like n=1 Tax=Ananas comosus TaxID=4615 RepID=A0A6P5EIE9_ANACO|nr:putrescine hydroxycinnamoyltransferase 1-like [Ananas comosus]
MVEVEIVESDVVVPSEVTPNHTLWLSNLDLLVARSHTPTVYFYRPNGHNPGFFSVQALKQSLAKALVIFYPLAGRLHVGPTGRIEIRCTGEGALFVMARSKSVLDEFGDFAPSAEMRRLLVPKAEPANPPCILVLVQVTFFKCGGVCLGVAVHHTAADGLGALHFVNAWADIARSAELPTPPFLDRTLLRARRPPAVLFDHAEYSQNTRSAATPPFDSTILRLSKDQLNFLKSTALGSQKRLSTFKAVVAHVWRAACEARGLGGAETTTLYMTADARTRVSPPLPQNFLGNAIFRTSATAKVEDVLSNYLEFGGERIQEATARLNDGFVRSLIDYLDSVDDVRGLQKGAWAMPGTDLWVISWLGLPIYEADFGWGRPVFMGRACLQFAGLVFVMHGPEGDGGISVAVALEPENMPRFKAVFYKGLDGKGGESSPV